jgi:hypothetical protein
MNTRQTLLRWLCGALLASGCDVGGPGGVGTAPETAAEARSVQAAQSRLEPTGAGGAARGDIRLDRDVSGIVTAIAAVYFAPNNGPFPWHLHAGSGCGNSGKDALDHFFLPDGTEPTYSPIPYDQETGSGMVRFEMAGMEKLPNLDSLNGKTMIIHASPTDKTRIACGIISTTAFSPPSPAPPCTCGCLTPGQALGHDQAVTSCDGRFRLVHQGDGNVVLYQGQQALWATGTDRRATETFEMQGDGNLVLYEPGRKAIWSSRSSGRPGSYLVVQDDGNAVVYLPNSTDPRDALWSSKTCCR